MRNFGADVSIIVFLSASLLYTLPSHWIPHLNSNVVEIVIGGCYPSYSILHAIIPAGLFGVTILMTEVQFG